MALINGDDAVNGRAYPYQHFNRIKNNFSQDAPQINLTNPQRGMTVSDNVDNRLWHRLAAGYEEILQAGGVVTNEGEVVCNEGEIVTCGI